MKKVLYVITAVIVLSVIMLFIFYNSGNAGTRPTLSQNDDTIKSKIESERPVYDRLLLELDSIEIYNDSIYTVFGSNLMPHSKLICFCIRMEDLS